MRLQARGDAVLEGILGRYAVERRRFLGIVKPSGRMML